MTIGIIIQARMGSKRLPDKMVLPLYKNKGMLEIIIERIKKENFNIPVIVATSDNDSDDKIEEIVTNNNISIYRGSENNVLSRFVGAAEFYRLNKIIRICADNLFVDMNGLRTMISGFDESDVDYWCYCKKNFTPTIKTHYGFWGEGVSTKSLKKINNICIAECHKEHVTSYIYENPSEFKILFNVINQELEKESQIRLTIDTPIDFAISKYIYSNYFVYEKNKNIFNLVRFIKKDESLLNRMKIEIKNNTK
jgi:spore coat polysaccharide biosynthesis protein SpsF